MLENFNIQIYIDGPSIDYLTKYHEIDLIKGFTFNPSLMKKAGIVDYEKFSRNIIELTDKPISLEVFADDFPTMKQQARKISSWGENIFVKIPITNTKGESSFRLIEDLAYEGIKLNITAIFTPEQIMAIEPVLNHDVPSIVSVFAGRIADTGLDPSGIMEEANWILNPNPNAQLLWASCREVYNVIQAENCGCNIITIPEAILNKLHIVGKNLEEYSKETVLMFYNDAKSCNYQL